METIENIPLLIQNKVPQETRKFHPVKFTTWLLMIASGMLFMAFTSALIVSKSDGVKNDAWMQFDIPMWFTVSTVIVVFASIFIHTGYIFNKKGNKSLSLLFTALAMGAGIGFIYTQFLGYSDLVSEGIFFSNENADQISGSYFYVITGAHLFHILLGLTFLLYTFIQLVRGKINATKPIIMYVGTFYWHFLGFLWIYLFLLLNLTR